MKPPFTITNSMISKVAEISKIVGNLEFQIEKNLKLRKENRIKSIHSSLAIEQNTLTVEQITDIIDGKRVLGNPKEIKEVKNAFEIYDEILKLDPYNQEDFLKAHGILTNELVSVSGMYRNKDVGIFNEDGKVIHLGARPQFVHDLMDDLFRWGIEDDTPALIKSCVFHYEIETIHPFEDGNGRMGRLWQTVILANWNPIFAWIPIETIIFDNQQAYYDALGEADKESLSNPFIELMLDIILETLREYQDKEISQIKNDDIPADIRTKLTNQEYQVYKLLREYFSVGEEFTTEDASRVIHKSISTVRRYLSKFATLEIINASGSNKNRIYSYK